MAKKTATKKAGRELTDAEIKKLATTLIDKRTNVYEQGRLMFGEGTIINDRTFERLEKLEGIFRCEECNVWQEVGERSPYGLDTPGSGTCGECQTERDGEDQDFEDEDENGGY